jgi:hypothetical protein
MPKYRLNTTNNNATVLLTSGDETDVAPAANAGTTAPLYDYTQAGTTYSASAPRDGELTTNTSGQIGIRAQAASQNAYLVTRGFEDFRRA